MTLDHATPPQELGNMIRFQHLFAISNNRVPPALDHVWISVPKLLPDALDLPTEVEERLVGERDVGSVDATDVDEAQTPVMAIGQVGVADVALLGGDVDCCDDVSPDVLPGTVAGRRDVASLSPEGRDK